MKTVITITGIRPDFIRMSNIFKKLDKELTLPKKIKGKRVNNKAFMALVANHIKDSMTAHTNPFWSLRP